MTREGSENDEGEPDAMTGYDALGNRVATNTNDVWALRDVRGL